MKNEIHQNSLRLMIFQRNAFFGLSVLSAISLALISTFIFWKTDRIIIVPPVVEKEFWVDNNNVSATYLEQFGMFLGELLLSKSANSAQMQRKIILRHTDPTFATQLIKKLIEEEQKLGKENVSYVFFPIDIQVDSLAKEVLLIGDRTLYVSGKPVSTERENYVLKFSMQGSRLLLNGITAKEGSK